MIITIISILLQAELLGGIINSLIDVTADALFFTKETSYCKPPPTFKKIVKL